MPDVINLHSAPGVVILFKRQDDQHPFDIAPDLSDAIAAPRPDLRADVIDDALPVTMQPFRQPQVEFRPVNQNHGVRLSFAGGIAQGAKGAQEFAHRSGDFQHAHNGDFAGINQRFNSGGAHLIAARAEQFKFSLWLQRAQCFNQMRPVLVARSFARNQHQTKCGVRSAKCGIDNRRDLFSFAPC